MKHAITSLLTRALSMLLICAMLSIQFTAAANARFISPDDFDPTMPGVGTNRYAYAGNDPVNKSDPNGHFWGVLGKAIAAAVGALLGGTTSANAPGRNDKPVSETPAQQIGGMVGGALAGVKAGKLVGDVVTSKKKDKETKAAEEVEQAATLQHDAVDDGIESKAPEKEPHGNKLDDRPATLYEKYSKNNEFEKHGITKHEDPNKRYSKAELDGGKAVGVERGPRVDMARQERERVETNPGPQNREPWAGKRKGGPV